MTDPVPAPEQQGEVCPGRVTGAYPHAYGKPPDDRCWWCSAPHPAPVEQQGEPLANRIARQAAEDANRAKRLYGPTGEPDEQGEPVCARCGHIESRHVMTTPVGFSPQTLASRCVECRRWHPFEPPSPPSSEEAEAQGTAVCAKYALPAASELHEPHIQPCMVSTCAYHPFEAQWWVDSWCAKHNGHHLQHGEDGSRMVVADYESGEMVCQLLNEAAAIRSPLEERVHTLEEDILAMLDGPTVEERVRELEALVVHGSALAASDAECIQALEEERDRLRGLLRSMHAAGEVDGRNALIARAEAAEAQVATLRERMEQIRANSPMGSYAYHYANEALAEIVQEGGETQ